eukprot:2600300-Pleurochrysis_carterae.AAC.2
MALTSSSSAASDGRDGASHGIVAGSTLNDLNLCASEISSIIYQKNVCLSASWRYVILRDDRRKAICCVSLRCDYESRAKSRVAWRGEQTLPKTTLSTYSKGNSLPLYGPGGILTPGTNEGRSELCKKRSGVSLACTFSGIQIHSYSPVYTDKAKPPLKEPRTLRTEQELRQRGARRRDRDLGVDCLKRRSGNKQRGGERGDRKSRRA